MNDYIALIRRMPSPGNEAGFSGDLRDALRTYKNPLVFFHGDGVDALSGLAPGGQDADSSVDYCVCRTSLDRRSNSAPSVSPARVATLVTFYQAVVSARRVDSLGLGGWSCCRPQPEGQVEEGSVPLLLEIGFAAADLRQRREALEMALGAAALELEASVLFHGKGLAHLAGDAARGWAQIADFGLLGMYAQAPQRFSRSEIAVQTVNTSRAADLRARAGTILIL